MFIELRSCTSSDFDAEGKFLMVKVAQSECVSVIEVRLVSQLELSSHVTGLKHWYHDALTLSST